MENNNINIQSIKKSLELVSKHFDPEKSTYQILKNCIENNLTAEQLKQELVKIGSTNDYPKEFQNFFYNCFEELKVLAEKDKEIKQTLEEIKEKNTEFEQEMKKRNVEYKPEFVETTAYENMTYEQKKEYLSNLTNTLETMKLRIEGIKQEKQSGEKFDEKIEKPISNQSLLNPVSIQEIEQIQKESENNYRIINNPSVNDVKNYVNFYRENQQENSVFNIKIEYKNSSQVILDIGYKGTEVNENAPLYRCVYENTEEFERTILPMLVEEHVIDGGIKGYETKGDQISSTNQNDEELEIKGNQQMVEQTSMYLDNQVVKEETKENTMNNKNVRVRKLEDPYKAGKSNDMIIMILLMFIIAIILIVIEILT